MNLCVHTWDMEDDFLPTSNQKKSMGPDHELVELLWRNGQVVLNSQTHRKESSISNESVQSHKCDRLMPKDSGFLVNSGDFIKEDETASWIHYPLEDSLDREFCSNFLYELSNSQSIENDKPIKNVEVEKYLKFGASDECYVRSQPPNNVDMTANLTKQRDPNLNGIDRIENFPHFSRLIKTELGSSSGHNTRGKGSSSVTRGEFGEPSVKTVGSSHFGSNQLPNEAGFSQVSSNNQGDTGIVVRPNKVDTQKVSKQNERGQQMETVELTITSSSGGSFAGSQKQSMSIHGQKRKGRDADESECQSDDAEFESAEANKPPQRSGSAHRTRAAEVHNLSERRRRDRINEKMKALQELIPHCNKTDKASMLDEAIEYLKSLQLQIQMMWMGTGMPPMMFPGVQHYIPRMGMGIAPPPWPSVHNQMQMPRIPLVEQLISSASTPTQPAMCPPQVLNAVNFQNPLPSTNFPEQYAHFMGFHHLQTSQPMNIFSYGSQTAHQNIGLPSGSSGPCHGGASTANSPTSKLG